LSPKAGDGFGFSGVCACVLQGGQWVIAVVVCIVASFISNFGLNLQKLALTKKQNGSGSKAAYRWIWFIGAEEGSLCQQHWADGPVVPTSPLLTPTPITLTTGLQDVATSCPLS
jgi:hypothetical protein